MATTYVGNVIPIDDALDATAAFYNAVNVFQREVSPFLEKGFVRVYGKTEMNPIHELTLELMQHTSSTVDATNSLHFLLGLHDSTVAALFHAAKRNMIFKDSFCGSNILARPVQNIGLSLIEESLPTVVSADLRLLQRIKDETRGAVDSFKQLLRRELHKYISTTESNEERWTTEPELTDFKLHIVTELKKIRSSLDAKINDIKEEKAEAKYGIFGAALLAIGLGVVTNPAAGLITATVSAHNFAQKWMTLKAKEEGERGGFASGEYGLFLRFESLRKHD